MNAQKLKINPNKMIQNQVLNMSFMKNVKYALFPEEIEIFNQRTIQDTFQYAKNWKKLKNFLLELIDMIRKGIRLKERS